MFDFHEMLVDFVDEMGWDLDGWWQLEDEDFELFSERVESECGAEALCSREWNEFLASLEEED